MQSDWLTWKMESPWHHGIGMGGCLLAAGGVAVLYKCRHRLVYKLLSWRVRRLVRRCRKKIYIVNSEETWSTVLPLLLREVGKEGVLGMDCEWVEFRGYRHPVALLQLASHSGMCVLVQLAAFTTPLPHSLQGLLRDATIIKAGVGIIQDKRFLEADYGLQVKSCMDLRYLVSCWHDSSGLGLAALSLHYLGHTLDKDWRVRASNWGAEHLTDRQKSYAAEDALVGAQLLMVLCARLWLPGGCGGGWLLPFLPRPFFCWRLVADIHAMCHPFLDLHFSDFNTRPPRQGMDLTVF